MTRDKVIKLLKSIKAYGNAIVPQIALQIFNAINLHAASYGWH